MADDAWTFTFIDMGGKCRDGSPRSAFADRCGALGKQARYYGLRAVADLPLIRKIFDQHCKDLCDDCEAGVPVKYDPAGVGLWWHPRTKMPCGAHRLRVKEQERRRAKDAERTDAVAVCDVQRGTG